MVTMKDWSKKRPPNPLLTLYKLLEDPRMVHWHIRWFFLRRLTHVPVLRDAAIMILIEDSYDKSPEGVKGESIFRHIISRWDGVFIDVGAYIGDTMIIARRAKAIIGIEPVQQHVRILQHLSRKDGRITVIPAAAGDGSQLEFLQLDSSTDSMFTEARLFKKWAIKRRVVNKAILKTVRIDDLHIPEGDLLIKIDVEDGELRVLRGAEKTISERSPVLLIECHGTYDQVADFLARYGYEFMKYPGIKEFKGHCYLVATRKNEGVNGS